jgi:putative thymidine phosphorylase
MSNITNNLLAKEAIRKKLSGRILNYKEIYAIMDEIATERLGDILTTYFTAAGFHDGFTEEELYFMTKAMVETGTRLKFSGIVADKHSIGGIAGTRTTMIVVPIVTSFGYIMPKTSSRAITSPAGTADVMEVLCKVTFTPEQVQNIVSKVGGCIIWGGHLGIAPADDVIIRVEEPLSFESFDKIIVSIMAKKVAAGANHLVIDIPLGKTMKVRHKRDAEILKNKFEGIASRFGIKILVDINQTGQPEGNGIGPTLEAIDVIKVLEQDKTRSIPLEQRALRLAGKLLNLCFETQGIKKDGFEEAKKILSDGTALKKMREIVKAQYGDPEFSWKSLKTGTFKKEIKAMKSGKITEYDNKVINAVSKILGAPNDKKAGIELHKRASDNVISNDIILTLHSSSKKAMEEAEETLKTFKMFYIE